MRDVHSKTPDSGREHRPRMTVVSDKTVHVPSNYAAEAPALRKRRNILEGAAGQR